MKYQIKFKERGELTDKQKEGLLKKLKLKLVKEVEKGSVGIWTVQAAGKLTDEDLAKALKFYKLSREMSDPEITQL